MDGIVIGALESELPAGGGIQRYAAGLVPELLALEERAVALVASPAVGEAFGERAVVARPRRMARGNFVGNLLRVTWHQTALPRLLRERGARLFYSTTTDGMLAPACPQVVTVHDLIPLLHPRSAPRLQYHFRYVVPRIVRASAAVVAMSKATRADLERFYGVPGERVHVVHQGYRSEVFHTGAVKASREVARRFGLGRYFLATADGRSYKNIPRVIEAFARLLRNEPSSDNPARNGEREVRSAGDLVRGDGGVDNGPGRGDVQLALVGRSSRKEVDLPALAAELGVADRTRFLGFVTDEELAALYAGAEAFVFPSLYEGFGIPPLEAMACGCPVIVAERASLPEVCGDAALYVDPERMDDIAAAMGRILAEPELRAGLARRGPERAAHFSYRTAAAAIREVLHAVAERCGGVPV
ncbi:MAG TPA: glycosyltransferase family 1 protein [Longimicrobiaceae bacterium]